MQHKQSVIIVGGGLAGLTAGYDLCKDGRYEVTLLEGSERLGGRVYTLEGDGPKVDMGGFMVFPWYKYFKSLLDELDLTADLEDYRSYTEFYQQTDGSYMKDTEVPIWRVFPWRMLQHLIVPFFTNKLDFYEPDLRLLDNLTAREVFENTPGSETDAEYLANELATSYTYADLKDIPVSLYLGFGYKLLAHHGFDKCRSLRGGTDRVVDAMVRAIEHTGGTIRTGSPVIKVGPHSVQTADATLQADKIILAQGADTIVSELLADLPKSRAAWYTNHYAVAVKVKEQPLVAGTKDWMVTYNHPAADTFPHIVSIGNLSALNIDDRTLILYVRIHPEDSKIYTEEDIQAIVTQEIGDHLQSASIEEFLAVHHWQHTMPVVQTELVAAIRQRQGKDGIYFAGDYLGSPCMETAVYTGRRAAALIKND